jgi:hypothetical protein
MSANIFISFAGHDLKVASTLCKALESRGFKCWISSRDILPGENFQVAIVRAIRNAKMMLLVFTGNSNNSEEMTKELALASQHKLMVVPLRIEDVTPNDAFAYEFATRQWIDFFADWELAMNQLSDRIASAIPPETSSRPEPVGATLEAAESPAPLELKIPGPSTKELAVAAVAPAAAPVAELTKPEPKPAPEPTPASAPEPVTAKAAPDPAPAAAPAPLAAKIETASPSASPAPTAPPRPEAKKSPLLLFVVIGAIVVLAGGAALLLPSLLAKNPPAAAPPAPQPAKIVAAPASPPLAAAGPSAASAPAGAQDASAQSVGAPGDDASAQAPANAPAPGHRRARPHHMVTSESAVPF